MDGKIDATRGLYPSKGVKPRIAEEGDTQNAIDREDADRHRRGKKTDPDKFKAFDLYEDLTEVSLPLLRGFLQNLLDTRDRVRDTRREQAIRQPYAMQAYQTAKNAAHEAPPPPPVAADAEVLGFSRLDLAAEGLDKDEIKSILSRLADMEAAGIQYLAIERSASFLQSIRDGMDRAVQETLENPVEPG